MCGCHSTKEATAISSLFYPFRPCLFMFQYCRLTFYPHCGAANIQSWSGLCRRTELDVTTDYPASMAVKIRAEEHTASYFRVVQ